MTIGSVGFAVEIEDWGVVDYGEALARQEAAVADRGAGRAPDRLILVEHPPVVTLGRGARERNLLVSRRELQALGVDLYEVGRGGDVTYHAPGQLVGYPVLDLSARGACDVHAFLRDLELTLSEALEALGVPPLRIEGYTGVFVAPEGSAAPGRPRKIASIGVGVRRWVTFHGFALNVDLDLAGFARIVPCGLDDVEMTSVARELGSERDTGLGARARAAIRAAFLARFR